MGVRVEGRTETIHRHMRKLIRVGHQRLEAGRVAVGIIREPDFRQTRARLRNAAASLRADHPPGGRARFLHEPLELEPGRHGAGGDRARDFSRPLQRLELLL